MPRDGTGFPGRGDVDAGEVRGGADSMDQVRLHGVPLGLVLVVIVVLVVVLMVVLVLVVLGVAMN